jgi:hypothetical protein
MSGFFADDYSGEDVDIFFTMQLEYIIQPKAEQAETRGCEGRSNLKYTRIGGSNQVADRVFKLFVVFVGTGHLVSRND